MEASRKKVNSTDKERAAYYVKQNKGSNNGDYVLVAYDSPTGGNIIGYFKTEDEIIDDLDNIAESSILEMFNIGNWADVYITESIEDIITEASTGVTKENIITKFIKAVGRFIDFIIQKLTIFIRNIKAKRKNKGANNNTPEENLPNKLLIKVVGDESDPWKDLIIDFNNSFRGEKDLTKRDKNVYRVKRVLTIIDGEGLLSELDKAMKKFIDAGFENTPNRFNAEMKEFKDRYDKLNVNKISNEYKINDMMFSISLKMFEDLRGKCKDQFANLNINKFKHQNDYSMVVEGFNVLMALMNSIANDISLLDTE